MYVKRKLNTKTLKEKCDIPSYIESDTTNKEEAAKFGVPKNTISICLKTKEKLIQAPEEISPSTNKLRHCQYEKVDKVLFD